MVTLGRPGLHSPTGWTPEDERLGAAHFAYWQRQTAEGQAILVGRTLDQDGEGNLAPDALGMMIFQASDRASAEAVMAADPGVAGGVFVARVSSYAIVLQRPSARKTP